MTRPRLAILLALAPILAATLYPGTAAPVGWTLWFSSPDPLAEIVQNLLLFIPLGAALAWAGAPLRLAVPLGALLSVAVEFAQQWIPGRESSGGDILCNTLSTAIGVTLVQTADRWLHVPPRRAAWQALGAAVLAGGLWVAMAGLISWGRLARRTLGDGWRAVFYPELFPDWLLALINAAWLGAAAALVGFWVGRAPGAGRHPAAVAAALGVLAVVLVVPVAVGMRPTPPVELGGTVGGLAAGYLTGIWMREEPMGR